jgi:hypothetical protein
MVSTSGVAGEDLVAALDAKLVDEDASAGARCHGWALAAPRKVVTSGTTSERVDVSADANVAELSPRIVQPVGFDVGFQR